MASNSIFGRVRASSKIGADYDQAGNVINIETREDSEQQVRFDKIIDLLVAAGYFRARIKGLSSFDKVVGGMTWCITNCNYDLDIDLLFQENSTIGQKISLTEKIVRVLPKMKCPVAIEPHQIQGQDFKSIFPVIQWLVKKVIETREETGDLIRAYSISQFDKHHKLPGDEKLSKNDSISTLRHHYRPIRKYKRSDKLSLTTEEAKVSSTLLEYGGRSTVKSRKKKTEDEEKNGGTHNLESVDEKMEVSVAKVSLSKTQKLQEEIEKEENEIRLAEEKTLQKLRKNMSEMSGKEIEGRVASKIIGSIVEMQSKEIQEISSEYAKKKEEIEARLKSKPVVPTRLTPKQKLVIKIEKLSKTLLESKEAYKEAKENAKPVALEKRELKEKLEELTGDKKVLDEKMEELSGLEAGADSGVVSRIRELVSLNEELKRKEAKFKADCKAESVHLKEEIANLKRKIENRSSTDDENLSMVERQLSEDKNKLAKTRLLLASKNREVARLGRRIDEAPSRAELTQYQRRFVELYDQISSTHKETKQYYTLYNTLNDSLRYMEKEVDLLDSIYDSFETAKTSQSAMVQYLKQFEKIVAGIRGNKMKVEKKLQMEKMRRDELSDRYSELVEKQRLYVKTIRDFQEECRRNEILCSKLKS